LPSDGLYPTQPRKVNSKSGDGQAHQLSIDGKDKLPSHNNSLAEDGGNSLNGENPFYLSKMQSRQTQDFNNDHFMTIKPLKVTRSNGSGSHGAQNQDKTNETGVPKAEGPPSYQQLLSALVSPCGNNLRLPDKSTDVTMS